jgi:glycosyltransferase involved in cell wall biosynthesis
VNDGVMRADWRPLLLYVTDTEGLGGAEGYLRTLLLHADQRRYRVGLALPPRTATQPLVDQARAAGVQVLGFEGVHRDGLSPGAVARASALLSRLRPALVHFVLASPRRCAEIVIAAWLARVSRRLATFQLVTPVPHFNGAAGTLRALNRRLQYRTLHHGIAVSTGNRRLLVEQYGFPDTRLALIPNAIDTEQFRPGADTNGLRDSWGIPRTAPLLGVVGRLSRQKGQQVLFEALPRIWSVHPDTHVALIGAGELESDLRAQALRIDPRGRIHFVGQQEQVPAALAGLDLFVLPSLYEGLPFAVLEAMAMERAIVATAVDGTVEVIEPERSGVLVPPGAAEPLAAAVIRLLGDPELRARLGQSARAAVVARFDQQHMLERTFALYET